MPVYAVWRAYVGTDDTTVDDDGVGYSRRVGEFVPVPGVHLLNQHHDNYLITGHVDRYVKIEADGKMHTFGEGVFYDTRQGREAAMMGKSGALRFVSGQSGGAGEAEIITDDEGNVTQLYFKTYMLGPLAQVGTPAFPGAGFLSIDLVDEQDQYAPAETMMALAASADITELNPEYRIEPEADPVESKSAEDDWGFHALIAGAGIDTYPDASFTVPESPVPMPFTVFDDMSFCGHIAIYGTCHIAYKDKCVTPPVSNLGYTPAHQGTVKLDSGGLLRVARLSYGANHAASNLNPRATADHYENAAKCGGFSRVLDGEIGIWQSGHLNRRASDEMLSAFASAAVSGDWRKIRRNLELVGILSVNIPGFTIPDPATYFDGENQTALIASGAHVMAEIDGADSRQWAKAHGMTPADSKRRAEHLAVLDLVAESVGQPTREQIMHSLAVEAGVVSADG